MSGAPQVELGADDQSSLQTSHSIESLGIPGNCGEKAYDLHPDGASNEDAGLSKRTTLRDKTLMVPRSERRGILANLTLVPEYRDARDYPPKMKGFIVLMIAFAAMMGPMGTSIIFPSINPITRDFKTSTIMVNVSVGIYLLGLGILPIWWSSLSELRGRRTVYVLSFTLLFGFCIGCALSPNISAFIVFRMLCGASSASVQSVGAGTVADLFKPEERGKFLGYYYLGALTAPLTAPIIGSLLVSRWSWRSTQWFLVILAGVTVMLLTLLLPETLRLQESKSAIALILAQRRAGAKPERDATSSDAAEKDHAESSNDGCAGEVESANANSDVAQDDIEINRIFTRTSELAQYPPDEEGIHGDVMAPQITKLQTRDRKLEQRLREGELKKWKTNVENELERMETERNNKATKTGASKTIQPQKRAWKTSLYLYLVKPLKSLHFLRFPPVVLTITFSAISFCTLYFVNMTIEYSYSRPPYNFKPLYVGLLYIPNSVTYIIASVYGGRWVDNLLKRYKQHHGILAPEARISWNVVTAVVCFPISLLIIGWCLDKKQHWVTPLVGTALFGFASMMTIGATVSYLVDSLPGKGATGVALNNLIRQVLAAVAVFVTEPMLKGMGTGWAFTMLAIIVVAASSVLLILKMKGDYWRENFDLQELYDKLE
ncbi:LAME_0F05094g1_1 [Lachancea meyersii CBS 8951]|uniref:LAME_0F05094g1_1 n=1 Tax=Lachancea meyersii CBS 8951 TaxID=1266667 RepID=A0A1G4JSI6_9SACH|nr:LAME_0F05094g1_1 [Lachancea meyersii CBS 8951]